MRLKIQNIGMIEYADVNLDGLTVIAGENDTGKSTVSKVLYSVIKSFSKDDKISLLNLQDNLNTYFAGDISKHGNIYFENDGKKLDIQITDNNCEIIDSDFETTFLSVQINNSKIIMIETPLIWNLLELFTKLPMIEDEMDIDLEYPKIMKDLHWNLSIKSKNDGVDISQKIADIINGNFIKDDFGNFYFQKNSNKIKLINTATGIKYFGILQTLSNNKHFYKNQILVLDEPEVHLHPKWQLKLAEIIVSLVKDGVKILVNSHSPYMIEALQKYGKDCENVNFYLAQNRRIEKANNLNSDTLSKIFEELSEPFAVFDEMDSNDF